MRESFDGTDTSISGICLHQNPLTGFHGRVLRPHRRLPGQCLTEAERTAFESELQSDPALATALQQMRETRERLARQWAQEGADAELRHTLKDLGQQHFIEKQPTTRRVVSGNWWRAAAAAVAAILVAWFVWPAGDEDMYERFRQFPEAGFSEKGSSEQTLSGAEKAFNAKEYKKRNERGV
ncbi:MAG: hypothetical protein IPL27_11715 [Lewinellaceae bacterium]|nr:hypothetical protein [Lewinellaceae bacterium]